MPSPEPAWEKPIDSSRWLPGGFGSTLIQDPTVAAWMPPSTRTQAWWKDNPKMKKRRCDKCAHDIDSWFGWLRVMCPAKDFTEEEFFYKSKQCAAAVRQHKKKDAA